MTMDDDNFIDDSGVDPAVGYGNGDEPHSPGQAPQVHILSFHYSADDVMILSSIDCLILCMDGS
jgi:hypothetical protein